MEKKEKARSEMEKNRVQVANIRVRSGYSPDVITARSGKLLHVNFLREELVPCTEKIFFPDFGKEVKLVPFQVVSTEFVPQKPGEYNFQCEKGKIKGKLVVS